MISIFLYSRALRPAHFLSHGTYQKHLNNTSLTFIKYSGYYSYHLVVSLEFFIYIILPAELWPWG